MLSFPRCDQKFNGVRGTGDGVSVKMRLTAGTSPMRETTAVSMVVSLAVRFIDMVTEVVDAICFISASASRLKAHFCAQHTSRPIRHLRARSLRFDEG